MDAILKATGIASLLSAGTSVTLQASNDITLSQSITNTNALATLTLRAGSSLILNDKYLALAI